MIFKNGDTRTGPGRGFKAGGTVNTYSVGDIVTTVARTTVYNYLSDHHKLFAIFLRTCHIKVKYLRLHVFKSASCTCC